MEVAAKTESYLRKAFAEGASDDEIAAWLGYHAPKPAQGVKVTLAGVMMRTLLESAVEPRGGPGTSLFKDIDARKALLIGFAKHRTTEAEMLAMQAVFLFAAQQFCHDQDWPPGLITKLFYQLYNTDVVYEDAFGIWREDTTDRTPGKDKALIQASGFLAWLDEAASPRADCAE